MPSRILREGILTSDRINTLSAAAEVFYRRLMSVVDDFGRFDGRASILRVSCYPLRVDAVREADLSRWIAECVKAGLLVLYAVDGKPYLEMQDFRQQTRAKSKFPPPSDGQVLDVCDADAAQPPSTRLADAKQTPANATVFGVGVGVEGGVVEPTASSPAKPPTCPVDEVIAVYHEVLPELPKVKLHTQDRVKVIRKVWAWLFTDPKPSDKLPRAATKDEALDWFRRYFTKARDNDFLMGRTPRTGEHANWRCDLDFLLTDRGKKHVLEKTPEAES